MFFRCDGSLKISIPPCFPIAPAKNSTRCIKMTRSAAVCQSDPADLQPREQINVLTAFIDGSQIYGSLESVAKKLRSGMLPALLLETLHVARDLVLCKLRFCHLRLRLRQKILGLCKFVKIGNFYRLNWKHHLCFLFSTSHSSH